MTLHGTPAATTFAGMSFVITLPEPIIVLSPIVTPWLMWTPAPTQTTPAATPVQAETVSIPTPSAPSNPAPQSGEAVLSNVLPKSTLQSVEGMLGKLKDKTADSPIMQTATDNAIRRFKNIFGSSQGS